MQGVALTVDENTSTLRFLPRPASQTNTDQHINLHNLCFFSNTSQKQTDKPIYFTIHNFALTFPPKQE